MAIEVLDTPWPGTRGIANSFVLRTNRRTMGVMDYSQAYWHECQDPEPGESDEVLIAHTILAGMDDDGNALITRQEVDDPPTPLYFVNHLGPLILEIAELEESAEYIPSGESLVYPYADKIQRPRMLIVRNLAKTVMPSRKDFVLI